MLLAPGVNRLMSRDLCLRPSDLPEVRISCRKIAPNHQAGRVVLTGRPRWMCGRRDKPVQRAGHLFRFDGVLIDSVIDQLEFKADCVIFALLAAVDPATIRSRMRKFRCKLILNLGHVPHFREIQENTLLDAVLDSGVGAPFEPPLEGEFEIFELVDGEQVFAKTRVWERHNRAILDSPRISGWILLGRVIPSSESASVKQQAPAACLLALGEEIRRRRLRRHARRRGYQADRQDATGSGNETYGRARMKGTHGDVSQRYLSSQRADAVTCFSDPTNGWSVRWLLSHSGPGQAELRMVMFDNGTGEGRNVFPPQRLGETILVMRSKDGSTSTLSGFLLGATSASLPPWFESGRQVRPRRSVWSAVLAVVPLVLFLAGCRLHPDYGHIILSYAEDNSNCVNCASFRLEFRDGGHVDYTCLRGAPSLGTATT